MPLSPYMKSRQQKIFGKAQEKKEKETPVDTPLSRNRQARVPKEPKEDKQPAKRGEKLKELFKGYKKLLKIFLSKPENLRCGIRKACNGAVSECVHHQAGRTGPKLKDESDWMPACFKCNTWVEEHDAEARELGFKKTRMGKVKK